MKNDYNRTGVDATTRGTALIGFVQAHKYGGSVFVEEIMVEEVGGQGGFFNVQLDGRQIFSNTQSVTTGTTPETFEPDQNRHATGDNLALDFEVVNQESASETYNVGVLLSTGDE